MTCPMTLYAMFADIFLLISKFLLFFLKMTAAEKSMENTMQQQGY